MAELIVDFPQRLRISGEDQRRGPRRTVRFAPMSQIQVFERIDEANARKIWYSDRDYAAIRLANSRSVQELHALATHPDQAEVSQALAECATMGFEQVLTPKLAKRTKANRVRCWGAVLDEQDRQDREGASDPMKIALASIMQTRKSSKRAHDIGKFQSLQATM